jgi:hypothetical protein
MILEHRKNQGKTVGSLHFATKRSEAHDIELATANVNEVSSVDIRIPQTKTHQGEIGVAK